MFEQLKIRREFSRIVSHLKGSDALPVHPDIFQFFERDIDEFAAIMRRHKWSAFGTCIFMISSAANHLAEQGSLGRLKAQNVDIYQSLKHLYGFALLAIGKRPDAERAFMLPENGRSPFDWQEQS